MNDFISIERFEKNALAKVGAKTTSNSKIISIIIMEAGAIDLKKASAELGPLRDENLVRVARSMASSLAKIHNKGLVWTDLKTDNYVFVKVKNDNDNVSDNKDGENDYFSTAYTCKAIDLESAVLVGKPIVDFSPEISAPEQIKQLTGGELSSSGGRASDYTLAITEPILARKETDVWALGISILHMYLGRYEEYSFGRSHLSIFCKRFFQSLTLIYIYLCSFPLTFLFCKHRTKIFFFILRFLYTKQTLHLNNLLIFFRLFTSLLNHGILK